MTYEIRPIAHIRTDFPDKFGIPRQSRLVPGLVGRVVFEKEFASPEALRGLEGFSHIWLIWAFSGSGPSRGLTVRPPRLGGNRRVGVFATRSPVRPNPIGMSAVRLLRIEGTDLIVEGADMVDGTPILDIKPYLTYTDSIPDAVCGFAAEAALKSLKVELPEDLAALIPEDRKAAVLGILAQDPRPAYQEDPERIYGILFAGMDIKFKVKGDRLTVVSVEETV